MQLRPPAVPLITIDPYFSIWSVSDQLNQGETVHWTGKPNRLTATVRINGTEYLLMGVKEGIEVLEQVSMNVSALSTMYIFRKDSIQIELCFTSPLLLNNLKVLSRPVSYLKVCVKSLDEKIQDVTVHLLVEDDICQNQVGEEITMGETVPTVMNAQCVRMGTLSQKVLNQAGDDLRINWGYFYLAVVSEKGKALVHKRADKGTQLEGVVEMSTQGCPKALFAFAYDDLECIQYFYKNLKGYWVKESGDIATIIHNAVNEYGVIVAACQVFSKELWEKAAKSGGEHYAQLLALTYRQVIAAHKLCLDTDGQLLFISKECFSNGCAATVDVTYPSIPLFLLYCPELVEGMLRPVFKYAESEDWIHDFAPHDVGTYPLLNGQTYWGGDLEHQMPIEECGNMLVTMAALCIAKRDFSFAKEHMDSLKKWAEYLIAHGRDPENQLCTDDFAGHLAHNCNLAIKAIMGVVSYGIITDKLYGDGGSYYMDIARDMAKSWVERAKNEDGTYKLAFNSPGTFSMKYNAVWDMVFRTEIFEKEVFVKELKSYSTHMNAYGMPLDNRATYTKSDWLVWCAAMMEREDFIAFVEPLFKTYHESKSRVPMTDWYETTDARQVGFQHRTVQGGLFIKLLMDQGLDYRL